MKQVLVKAEIVAETKQQLWLALPLVAAYLLQFSLNMISTMFVGHLGKLPLAGASMAVSFTSVTGFHLLMGMSSALETLCGQAFGAKQHNLVGIYTQRAAFILLLICIPLSLIWGNTYHILVFVKQDPKISASAGFFARWMILAIFATAVLQCQFRFLQTQNKIIPIVVSTGSAALLHVLLCWILVFKLHIGLSGPALALGISNWFIVLFLALYIHFSPACAKTWTGFSKAAFHDTMKFVKLAVPSACMVCLRSWSFQLTVFMSGLLPNPELKTAVMSIGLNTYALFFMIPFALGNTISTRVSNELGSGHPKAACLAVCVGGVMALSVCTLTNLGFILVRNVLGHAYSSDENVVTHVASTIPLIAASNLLDGIQSILSGTVRGCGWQKMGAYANLAAYYLVGVPSGALLAFLFNAGIKGLWIGITAGITTQVLLLFAMTLRINWEQEVRKAEERIQNSGIPVTQQQGDPLSLEHKQPKQATESR